MEDPGVPTYVDPREQAQYELMNNPSVAQPPDGQWMIRDPANDDGTFLIWNPEIAGYEKAHEGGSAVGGYAYGIGDFLPASRSTGGRVIQRDPENTGADHGGLSGIFQSAGNMVSDTDGLILLPFVAALGANFLAGGGFNLLSGAGAEGLASQGAGGLMDFLSADLAGSGTAGSSMWNSSFMEAMGLEPGAAQGVAGTAAQASGITPNAASFFADELAAPGMTGTSTTATTGATTATTAGGSSKGLIQSALDFAKANPQVTSGVMQVAGGALKGLGDSALLDKKLEADKALQEQKVTDAKALEEWKRGFTQSGSYFAGQVPRPSGRALLRPDGTPVFQGGIIASGMGG